MQHVCISTFFQALLVQIQTKLPEETQFYKQSKTSALRGESYVSQNCYENRGGKLNKALLNDYSFPATAFK